METHVAIGTDIQTDKVVAIDAKARARSTYVIGITGCGKSNLLETMAYLDMQNGDGLCFLDPHGDSSNKLLASIPSEREDDVIFWNPSDIERPLGLNPFSCIDPTNEFAVSRIAESFVKALGSLKEFASIFESAPRMKNLLEHLAITFIVNQGHTLAETPEFLTRQEYRQQFYPRLSEQFARVRRYWELEFDALSPREQEERRESSLNKLTRFQTDPVLFGIFGQPKTAIDLRKAMDEGAIIIVDLSADDQGFLGAFLVWGIMEAARSRAKIPESDRRPFHLFSDEFQTYMTTAFPDLQAQARKFGVDTVVAHQVREQLDPEIREITRAAGNLIIFRVTYPNAASLAGEFDTTPPAPPKPMLPRRQAHLVLSPSPWIDLLQKGHKNREVVAVLDRIKKLFYHRNAKDFTQRVGLEASGFTVQVTYAERDWNSSTPMPFVTKSSADPSRWTVPIHESLYHPYLDYSANPLPLDALAEWANPYFCAREQGRDEAQPLEDMLDKFCFLHPKVDLATYETQMSGHLRWNDRVLRSEEAAREVIDWTLRYAIREALRKEIKRLAFLLVKEPMMTESGQYVEEVVQERPIQTSGDVVAEIANALVHLDNYQARCKISQRKGRPTEHTILTLRYPGTEDYGRAQRLTERSQERFGRDKKTVERAIEERLRVERKTNQDEREPILREKSEVKIQITSKQKRLPRISPDDQS